MSLLREFTKLSKYLLNSDYRFIINTSLGCNDSMPDEPFLKRFFKAKMGYDLDLENPKTFSEKLQWLKLYNRKPEYTMMVDKYKVRDYVAEKLGEEYLIPLIGVWDNPDDIEFDILPDKFVLKCNHNSGLGMCICRDKSTLDIKKVKAGLKAGLRQDYFITCREWPYKDVPKKIVCEKFMIDDSSYELKDYKFFCFDGEAMYCQVIADRSTDETIDFFDKEWNHMDFIGLNPSVSKHATNINKPKNYDKMVELAGILSKGHPFLRVDFYNINGKIYFGELTFFPQGGFGFFRPTEWNNKIGNLINLSLVK